MRSEEYPVSCIIWLIRFIQIICWNDRLWQNRKLPVCHPVLIHSTWNSILNCINDWSYRREERMSMKGLVKMSRYDCAHASITNYILHIYEFKEMKLSSYSLGGALWEVSEFLVCTPVNPDNKNYSWFGWTKVSIFFFMMILYFRTLSFLNLSYVKYWSLMIKGYPPIRCRIFFKWKNRSGWSSGWYWRLKGRGRIVDLVLWWYQDAKMDGIEVLAKLQELNPSCRLSWFRSLVPSKQQWMHNQERNLWLHQ